jgi:nicotinamidase-related amidase
MIKTLQIINILIITVIIISIGCKSIPTADDMTISIYPLCEYTSSWIDKYCYSSYRTREEIAENPDPRFAVSPEFEDMCSRESLFETLGTNLTQQLLKDPFFMTPGRIVAFSHSVDPNEVFYYYSDMFLNQDGWQTEREGNDYETGSFEGHQPPYCRVYRKGDKLIRFRNSGYTRYGDTGASDWLPINEFTLTFINMEPEEFLGKHYKQKGKEQFNEAYHVFIPLTYQKAYRESTKSLKDSNLITLEENTVKMLERSEKYNSDAYNKMTNSALVIIDMQKFACNPEVGYALPGIDGVVKNINILADRCRKLDIPIIWVCHDISIPATEDDYTIKCEPGQYYIRTEYRRDSLSSNDASIFSGMSVDTNIDFIVHKKYYSALASDESELKQKLDELNVKDLIIVGVSANVSVSSTIRDALPMGYFPILVSDATTAFDKTLLNSTISNMKIFFGEVKNTEFLLKDYMSQ